MPDQSTTSVEVIVTVDEKHRSKIAAVSDRLKAEGLSKSQTLKSAGLITGFAPKARIGRLKAVVGVQAIETSETVQIAPPDSGIQ
jgi:hypothetical protein